MSSFKSLGLKPEILQAVEALGFEKPSEIQGKAIPALLEKPSDLIGLAQTGTGKTASFGLPLAHLVDFNKKHVQAIVICPTRELCNQIQNDLENFLKFTPKAKSVAIYGGASFTGQLKELDKKPQIIVATPGRLMDMMRRKKIDLSKVDYCVLDEADEMLNMGFKEDIDSILSDTNPDKKVWLFSATMPPEIAKISKQYMHDPVEVTAGTKNSSAENLEHHYFVINGRQRFEVLKRTLDFWADMYGLVFCQTRKQVIEVADKLLKAGYTVDALHGDLSQAQRDAVMDKFRNKVIKVLVATDVAARGIDVNDISHVIHYNLPNEIENYTHRSGRTARAGKSGMSIALVSPSEQRKVIAIEKKIGKPLQLSLVPTGNEVVESQLASFLNEIASVPAQGKAFKPWKEIAEQELIALSKEDLIERVLALKLQDIVKEHGNAPDLNKQPGKVREGGRERSGARDDNENYTRLFINLGEIDKLDKGGMLRFVCDHSTAEGGSIGRIDVKPQFSFVDVHNQMVDDVLLQLNGINYNNRTVNVEISKSPAGGGDRRRKGGGKGRGRGDRKPSNRGGSGGGGGRRNNRNNDNKSSRPGGGKRRRKY